MKKNASPALQLQLASDFSVPIDLITNTAGIFGIRESGKTNTAGVIAEQIIKAGQPIVIVDPVGAWWGMKSSRDGKSAGLPIYVFGGRHADLPLEPTAGAVVARFMVEQRLPAILDLSLMRAAQKIHFMTEFAATLAELNREPLMVMIDEAHLFAPQSTMGRAAGTAECIAALEDIGTTGRINGLGLILIAQRPATVSATLRSQLNNLILMRTGGSHDRAAITEWLRHNASPNEISDMTAELAKLPTGTGYFWSPGWLHEFRKVHFRLRETFDSSKTPKVGERIITPKVFASIDTGKLSADIVATIERAKATDPNALRARIGELESALRNNASASDSARIQELQVRINDLERALAQRPREISVLTADDRAALAAATSALHAANDKIKELSAHTAAAIATITAIARLAETATPAAALPVITHRHMRPVYGPNRKATSPPAAAIAVVTSRASSTTKDRVTPGRLSGPEQKIVDAMMCRLPAACTRKQIAVLSGYSAKSGTFQNHLSSLRTKGLIETESGVGERLTQLGIDSASSAATTPQTSHETVALWLARLSGPEAKLLRALVAVYPAELRRNELADQTGYSVQSGTFQNHVSALNATGLASTRRPDKTGGFGTVRAADDLFPTGPIGHVP